jgi:DNA-binding NarL/FixJ family response regulator
MEVTAMNVFLVEDSAPIRSLLARRLQHMPGMCVVGEAAEEDQALALIRWTQPDLVMMDLSLSKGSGLNLLPELRRGGFKGRIAVLTSQMANPYRRICLEAGADAFYDKGVNLEDLFSELADVQHDWDDEETAAPTRPANQLLRQGLNDLCNETELYERLDQATLGVRRHGLNLAVYVVRVEGEEPLTEAQADAITARLEVACGDADFVVRRNADQFCVVMTRLADPAQAAAAAQRLSALMNTPLRGEDEPRRAALGMALFPTDAVTGHGLLTLAEAKAFGAI